MRYLRVGGRGQNFESRTAAKRRVRAWKMPENAAESHPSSARFVGRFAVVQDSLIETRYHCQHAQVLHTIESLAITENLTCENMILQNRI